MYKRIDFSNLGGDPVDQDSLDFMQQSYREGFGAVAAMVGNKRIVSGVQVVGGNVTDGWITYNGELIKFIGAAAGPDVVITETVNYNATFQDANTHDVEFIKIATIGSPGTFPFSDLSRVYVGGPLGVPEMFAGQISKIPQGYGLCNGALLNPADYPELFDVLGTLHGGDGVTTFALPNLESRFIVGYDPADTDYDAIGKVGGEKKHELTIQEMPPHKHNFSVAGDRFLDSTGRYSIVESNEDRSGDIDGRMKDAGGDPLNPGHAKPHENRPPFYTLAYIIKLR